MIVSTPTMPLLGLRLTTLETDGKEAGMRGPRASKYSFLPSITKRRCNFVSSQKCCRNTPLAESAQLRTKSLGLALVSTCCCCRRRFFPTVYFLGAKVRTLQHACGCQRKACRRQFSLSLNRVEHRSLGVTISSCLLSHPTSLLEVLGIRASHGPRLASKARCTWG